MEIGNAVNQVFFPSPDQLLTFTITPLPVPPKSKNILLHTCNTFVILQESNSGTMLISDIQFVFIIPKLSQYCL